MRAVLVLLLLAGCAHQGGDGGVGAMAGNTFWSCFLKPGTFTRRDGIPENATVSLLATTGAGGIATAVDPLKSNFPLELVRDCLRSALPGVRVGVAAGEAPVFIDVDFREAGKVKYRLEGVKGVVYNGVVAPK